MKKNVKKDALNWISENKSRIVEISDKIWEFAELGLQEFKSSSLLAGELERAGFTVQRGVAGMPTAFVAVYGSGKPVIGILGEYDALPGLSQKPIPKKEPLVPGGSGHGCGHNVAGTACMAGAIATKAAMEANGIAGTVKYFGCPAEETVSSKVFMVRDGLFQGVDAVISEHQSSVNMPRMFNTNALNAVKFHFHGKAAHAAASPDQGRSALDAVELMNVGVNYMREHVTSEARIHYVTVDGGKAPNVVPPEACSWYIIRAPDRDQLEHIYNWVLNIANGADLMAGTTHDVEFIGGVYNFLPNRVLSELAVKNMREIGAPTYTVEELEFAQEIAKTIPPKQKKAILRMENRPGWEKLLNVVLDNRVYDPWDEGLYVPQSTDVGDVSWNAPMLYFHASSVVLGTAFHTWQMVATSGMSIGHKALIFAAKTVTACALDLLTKPYVLKKAREEFAERTQGHVYVSPLPLEMKPASQVGT